MTRDQALRQAVKRWGKSAYVQARERLSSPESRAAAGDTVKAARARIDAIDVEIRERLALLDWYQALQAERKAERAKMAAVGANAMYYKFSVGKVSNVGGMAFYSVGGQGDTWEQAFAQADGKRSTT
jgi:hypothetical protein